MFIRLFWSSTLEKQCSDCNKNLLKFPPGPAEETITKIHYEILNVAVRREIRWFKLVEWFAISPPPRKESMEYGFWRITGLTCCEIMLIWLKMNVVGI